MDLPNLEVGPIDLPLFVIDFAISGGFFEKSKSPPQFFFLGLSRLPANAGARVYRVQSWALPVAGQVIGHVAHHIVCEQPRVWGYGNLPPGRRPLAPRGAPLGACIGKAPLPPDRAQTVLQPSDGGRHPVPGQ